MPFSFETGLCHIHIKKMAFQIEVLLMLLLRLDSRLMRYTRMEDDKHAILLGMSGKHPLIQMCKFYESLALSPWSTMIDPPYSDC